MTRNITHMCIAALLPDLQVMGGLDVSVFQQLEWHIEDNGRLAPSL